MNNKTVTTTQRSLWPYLIILSFLLLAIFDCWIIYKAIQTQVGTTTDNPYADALRYNEIIKAKQASHSRGVSMQLDLEGKFLKVQFNGIAPTENPRTLKLELIRPDKPSLDRKFEASSKTDVYLIEIDPLLPGLWLIEATILPASKDQDEYYFEDRKIFN